MIILFTAGGRIRYGQPEPWKTVAEIYGRTKTHRGPKVLQKNDGRPPDTVHDLVTIPRRQAQRANNAANSSQDVSSTSLCSPSYEWSANSCWIDVAMELIFQVSERNFVAWTEGFASPIVAIQPNSTLVDTTYSLTSQGSIPPGLQQLYDSIHVRHTLYSESDAGNEQTLLILQRNTLRESLYEAEIIRSTSGFESVFVSILWIIQA